MKPCTLWIVIFSALALVGAAWAGADKAEQQLRLELDLVDGSRVIGSPRIESVPLQTSYARMDVPLREILTVRIESDHENASFDLRNGDKLKGVVTLGPIKLETVFGRVAIGFEHIRSFSVMLSGGPLPEALKRGLLLYYPFDKDDPCELADQSGSRNVAEVHGAKWVARGKVGGCYELDGKASYVSVPHSSAFDFGRNEFALCFWANLQQSGKAQEIIGKSASETSYGPFRVLCFENGQWGWVFDSTTRAQAIHDLALAPCAFNTWQHVAVTRRGDRVYFYLNGILIRTTVMDFAIGDNRQPLIVGMIPYQGGIYYACGLIDEVMLFNRALSEEEVKQLYNVQK